MSDLADWLKIGSSGGLGAVFGGFIALWRTAKQSGRKEAELEARFEALQTEVDQKIDAALDDVRQEIETRVNERNKMIDEFSSQFRETFNGIRQQINLMMLDMEKYFVRKDDVREVRAELNKDIREFRTELNGRLDRIEGKLEHGGRRG